jgi:Spy/CpxP family protein refolding chaperone
MKGAFMKGIIISGLNLILGLALLATGAMAWGPGFSQGFSMRPGLVFPDLPILGEKQFYKVEALEKVFLKEIEQLQHDVLTKRTELRILELAPDPDPTAVEAEQKEIRTLRSEIQEKVINLRFEIWKVLNPEQRAQFDICGPRIAFSSGIGRINHGDLQEYGTIRKEPF